MLFVNLYFKLKKFCDSSSWEKKYCFGHLKKNKNAFKCIFYESQNAKIKAH
jgi:hypothetical protein